MQRQVVDKYPKNKPNRDAIFRLR